MNRFLTLDDVDVAGRTVLVRADLNVPLSDPAAGPPAVTDDFRIRAALPTVARLREAGATVVLASHLGRPKGADDRYRMDPVAARMSELGAFEVRKLDVTVGAEVAAAVEQSGPGSVILLENTRFEAGETANDPGLAAALAEPVDLFVLDAFGTAHRAHASTAGVAEHVRSAAGPLLVAEVHALGRLLDDPPHPFTVVLGGAKVSDKLGVIASLLPKVDMMLVGGGMCFTLLAAQGFEVGDSLVESERIDSVRDLLHSEHGDRIRVPMDFVVADRFASDAAFRVVDRDAIPGGMMGLDIGPATASEFVAVIKGSAGVFWNGPMGVFEWEPFRAGTAAVGESFRGHPGFTVVGGGDSVAAVRLLGVDGDITHVSTGGGAGLEMLEGRRLPGIVALERWANGT